jgi:hypothetical protein
MEKSGKRGKIPQSDWPLIMVRYEAGETLSSIARTYDCSPPAISYIVSRSRAKPASDASAQAVTEPQLVKGQTNGGAPESSVSIEPTVAQAAPVAAIRREMPVETRPLSNGATTNGASNADPRRKLHLSLGGGNGNGDAGLANGGNGNGGHSPSPGDGNGHSHEPPPRPNFMTPRPPQGPPSQGVGERGSQRPFQVPAGSSAGLEPSRNGRDLYTAPEGRPAAQQPRDAVAMRKDNSAFIDQELRSRVDGDIAAFLTAFDAALAADTQESRYGLREATDRLLRAGARTRIELERLEARVPLTPHESAGETAGWRYR